MPRHARRVKIKFQTNCCNLFHEELFIQFSVDDKWIPPKPYRTPVQRWRNQDTAGGGTPDVVTSTVRNGIADAFREAGYRVSGVGDDGKGKEYWLHVDLPKNVKTFDMGAVSADKVKKPTQLRIRVHFPKTENPILLLGLRGEKLQEAGKAEGGWPGTPSRTTRDKVGEVERGRGGTVFKGPSSGKYKAKDESNAERDERRAEEARRRREEQERRRRQEADELRRLSRETRTSRSGRRGYRRQRSSRTADRTVWRSAVRAVRWLSRRGHPQKTAIRRIGLTCRTVRGWEERWRTERLAPRPRGRPVERPGRDTRNAILSLFGLVGPEITEEQLKVHFPEVPRAELRELKRRYRAAWRRKDVRFVSALRWTTPGSVWATDFTHPPLPVDGIFPRILAVRDLPSARQLELLPAAGEDAETARDLLTALIKIHGAPLVLKMDNGPGFKSELVKDLLATHGILPLYSPPYTPSYNGAVETGMGTLKTHAHFEAARNDRPGEWTCDDVEAARLRGNALGHPHGRYGPTPDEAWENGWKITEAERTRFLEVYEEEYRKETEVRGILPLIGPTPADKDSIDRHAISRALMRRGYLLIRRRRITPPVSQRKAAGIT